MLTQRLAVIPACAVVLALAVVGCGSDDGASVRNLDESDPAEDAGSSTATGELACRPIGSELEGEADQTIEVLAVDYGYIPMAIEVDAGVITFVVDNVGLVNHELAFLPGGGEVPFVDGAPDEEALEAAGAFELEGFSPGQTCNATYDLEPGAYTLFCIIETDGKTHYELGMKGTLVVS